MKTQDVSYRPLLILSIKAVSILAITLLLVYGVLCLNPYFKKNYFYLATYEKYKKLARINGPKIIILSGSSATYGINSVQMENALGVPVVNMGISHLMGTKFLLEFIKDHLTEGDLVLYAREYLEGNNMEHYGLIGEYAATALFATPWKVKMFFQDYDFFKTAITAIHRSARQSYKTFPKENRYQAYDHRFAEDNNHTYKIVANKHVKANFKSNIPIPNSSWLEVQDLIEFKSFVEDSGANIYLVPAGACDQAYLSTEIEHYITSMSKLTGIEILNGQSSFLLPSKYMHDSDFHPNYIGRYLRSKSLIADLTTHGWSKEVNSRDFDVTDELDYATGIEYNVIGFQSSAIDSTYSIKNYDQQTENYIRKTYRQVDLAGHFYFVEIEADSSLANALKFRSWGGDNFDLVDQTDSNTFFLLKRLDEKAVRNGTTLVGLFLNKIHEHAGGKFRILRDGLFSDPGDIAQLNVDTGQYHIDRNELILKKKTTDLGDYLDRLRAFDDKLVLLTTRGFEDLEMNSISEAMIKFGLSLWPLPKGSKVYSAVFSSDGQVYFETSDPAQHLNYFRGNTKIEPFGEIELRNAHNGLIKIDDIIYSEIAYPVTMVVFDRKSGQLFDLLNVTNHSDGSLRINRYNL